MRLIRASKLIGFLTLAIRLGPVVATAGWVALIPAILKPASLGKS